MIAETTKGLIIAGHLDDLPNPEVVTGIVLNAEGVTAQEMHTFVASLSRFSNLISLSVNSGNLPDTIAILATALQPTLQELDLSHNFLGDEGAKIVADKLSALTNLTTLDLSANEIDHIASHLAEQIAKCKALTSLILDDNYYSKEASSIFATVGRSLPHLTRFVVDHDEDDFLENEFASRANADDGDAAAAVSALHIDSQPSLDDSEAEATGLVKQQASSDDIQ